MQYTREDGCRAWLTYAQVPSHVLRDVFDYYGNAEDVFEEFLSERGRNLKSFLPHTQIDILRQRAQPEAMHAMMVSMQQNHIGIISQNDSCYPEALRTIGDPPVFLFYRGNLDCLMGRCIAMIGTRKPAPNTLEATRKIACDLSNAGVTIISGLAAGIDTAAHLGCLDGQSPTVALLANGMDIDYPSQNAGLKEQIIKSGGLLLTEYPPGCPAIGWHFPIRNRLIAGLSRAVVMMEGQIRSGSMTTVHHALEQGKDVYAYPGNIGSEWAAGTHQLLREGATYFTKAQDILDDMHWDDKNAAPTHQQKAQLPPLSDGQRRVYALLNQREMSFDELADALNLDASTLSSELTMLSILGLVKALPGKIFSKV